MAKLLASELRPGMLIMRGGDLFRVIAREHVHVGGRGNAYIQVELRRIKDGSKSSRRMRTDDKLEQPYIDTRRMQYLYSDDSNCVFMDSENFTQHELPKELLEGAHIYIQPQLEAKVSSLDGVPIAVEMPASVVMEVIDTEPRIKGATVTGSYKPATVNTGITVMVPPFIEKGEKIRVSTSTGEYQERCGSA